MKKNKWNKIWEQKLFPFSFHFVFYVLGFVYKYIKRILLSPEVFFARLLIQFFYSVELFFIGLFLPTIIDRFLISVEQI